MLTFIAIILSGVFVLMLESFSGGSEVFKFTTVVVGTATGFTWLYRFRRSWFYWLPRASCIIVFMVCNVAVFIFWYEAFYALNPTPDTYLTSGFKKTSNHSFISVFGPLLLMIVIARPSLRVGILGYSQAHSFDHKEILPAWKKLLWSALLGPGFLMGAYIAIHNFSLTTIVETFQGMGVGLAIVLLVLTIVVCSILSASILEKLSKKKALKDLQLMPQNVIQDIEKKYHNLMEDELLCLSHSIDSSTAIDQNAIASSKVGGKPYAESRGDWPSVESNELHSYFCMQLVLSSANLTSVWQGRLISVYLADWQVIVKSYGSPSIDRWVDITQNKRLFPERILSSSDIPYKPMPDQDDEEAWEDFFDINTVEYALRKSEELHSLLARYTKYSDRVLKEILVNANVYDGEEMDGILEGGAPYFIQGEHQPNCKICGNTMRFLFEFGEVLEPELTIGDAAMTYVFGCDAHPEHCVGFVDSH